MYTKIRFKDLMEKIISRERQRRETGIMRKYTVREREKIMREKEK